MYVFVLQSLYISMSCIKQVEKKVRLCFSSVQNDSSVHVVYIL